MSDEVTKKDIEDIVGKSTGEILEVLQTVIYGVDERFKKIEERLEGVSTEESIRRLTNTLDAFLKRIDDNETEQ